MEKFNLNGVIEYYKLDTDKLAEILFPTVKYPKLALARILKGEAFLDTAQLENLAKFIGVLPHDLFFIQNQWRGGSEDNSLIFFKGDYKAKLNYKGVFLSLYKKDKIIQQELTLKNMSVPEFINYLDNLIKNYENGNN